MLLEYPTIICEICKGTGIRVDKTLTNYHHNEYDEEINNCPACAGHGRVLKQTVITVTPLDEEQLKRKALYG